MEELITIAVLDNHSEAFLLKARLETNGITCILNDVYMNSLMPMGGFGGIKLKVPFSESFKAFDIYYEFKDDLDATVL